jgi:hypothetical protein
MLKYVSQLAGLIQSYHKNAMFKMILISFIHITVTVQNITRSNDKAVTINTLSIAVVVTLELRPAQQLQ